MPTPETPADDATERHPITPPTMRHMHGLFRNHGLTTDAGVHSYLSVLLDRDVKSRKDLTEAEARRAIEDLNAVPITDNPGGHGSLARALLEVQSTLPSVARANRADIPTNGGGSYSYRYADLADVVAAIGPLLVENGLAFTCLPRVTPSGGYELVGTLMHTTGEKIEGALPLFGRQAQELGSSITYGRRYLLGCMTGLVTDDDEDGALAAAQRARAEQQPPPWHGPSTLQLLDRISELATQQGLDPEAMTAKWRNQHGGLAYEALAGLEPWQLAPYVQDVENYITVKAREAAEAERVAAAQREDQPA